MKSRFPTSNKSITLLTPRHLQTQACRQQLKDDLNIKSWVSDTTTVLHVLPFWCQNSLFHLFTKWGGRPTFSNTHVLLILLSYHRWYLSSRSKVIIAFRIGFRDSILCAEESKVSHRNGKVLIWRNVTILPFHQYGTAPANNNKQQRQRHQPPKKESQT